MDKNKIKSYLSSNFLNEAKETADKPVGLKKTEDIQKANKSINDTSLKDVAKDIKANDKAFTANKTANAKEVKKRELDKDETETHENIELFQDTMLALDYDNPIDDLFKDRFEKSLVGHATMGNSNEYANVVQDKVWGGDPNFGQTLVDKTKAMSKVQQNVVGGGNAMFPYGVKNGNFAMNENNNIDKKDKMKRLVFKKPFNGLSNALNLIPESYRVDDKEFEMTDGNESYKVRWEGTLTEGRAIVLMGSSKEQVNEDIAKIKHLMGYSYEKTLGTLKGNQRLDENKRFSDIWGKTKSLLTESEDIEDQDAPEGEWDETKKAAEATKHVEGSVSKEKNFPNTPAPKHGQFADVKKKAAEATKHVEGSVANEKNYPNTPSIKTGEWDKNVKGQAADAKKHIHMHESWMGENEMNQAQGQEPKDVTNFLDKFDQNGAMQALFNKIDKKDEVIDFMGAIFKALIAQHPELSSSVNAIVPELKNIANTVKTQGNESQNTALPEGEMYEYDRLEEIFGGMDELENKEAADLDGDGHLTPYEKHRGETIEKAMKNSKNEGIYEGEGTTPTNEAIRLVILYGFNFAPDFIERVWQDDERLAKHLRGKWDSKSGSYKFYDFFLNLDGENQAKLIDYILSTKF
jgi:hypothetical protein